MSRNRPEDILFKFCDTRGRITRWPPRRRQQVICLEYLASKVVMNDVLDEPGINEVIKRWIAFGDHLRVRRALVDHGFIKRYRDGSRYWREKINVFDVS